MKEGDEVVWLHQPSGGYGYLMRIPCVIEEVREARVKVSVPKIDGSKVSRWVRPENLRETI